MHCHTGLILHVGHRSYCIQLFLDHYMHNQQPIRLKNDDTVIRATHSPFVRAMGFCFLLLSVTLMKFFSVLIHTLVPWWRSCNLRKWFWIKFHQRWTFIFSPKVVLELFISYLLAHKCFHRGDALLLVCNKFVLVVFTWY